MFILFGGSHTSIELCLHSIHTYLFHFQKKGKSVRAELVVRAHVCFLHQTKIIFFNFLLWCGQLKQQPGAFLVLVDLLGSFIWVQAHSSKLRGLRSTKCSSKRLQICYILCTYKKTYIDQGIQ